MAPLLFALLVVVVLAAAGYWSYQKAKKRRELLAQFAKSNSWTWVAQDDSWTGRFTGDPFGEGDHRRAKNVLQGQFRGRSMVAFDYTYQTHSQTSKGGQSTETHSFAFCALGLPASLPEVQLLPEGLLGRIGTALGMQDIELESEDFNRRYRVLCRTPKLAYDVLPPRTMQALLSRPALHLRLAGTDAMCWEQGQHTPVQLLARLDALSALVEGIPEFVWNDRKESSA